MKKIIVLSFLIIFLITGCARFNPGEYVIPEDGGFLAVINSLYTPEDISNYMLANFTYEAHGFTVQTPYELYLSKKGDCDEFSNFGVWVANFHGYETWQIQIFDNSFYSHYVAVYNESIWLSITDNQYYFSGFDDFKDIVEYVYYIRDKVWTKYIVYDYWNNKIEIGYN